MNDSPKKSNSGLGAAAAVIGVLGLIGVFVGKAQGMPNVFQSYLLGYLMWLMPTLGFLGIVILVNLVRGRFGYPILGISQAGARLLPQWRSCSSRFCSSCPTFILGLGPTKSLRTRSCRYARISLTRWGLESAP